MKTKVVRREVIRWSGWGCLVAGWLGAGMGCSTEGPAARHDHSEAVPKQGERSYPADETLVAQSSERDFDWYRWRGPDATGVSKETNWSNEWPGSGPKELWKAEVGIGFSSMAVSHGRVFTMGHEGDQDTVWCFDAATGDEVWQMSYAAEKADKYYEGGPSATPTVDDGTVYTLGKAGDLFCLEAATGKVIWSKNLAREIGAEVPTWGFAGSPLVVDEKLIVNVGSYGTALNKKTGEILWQTGKEVAGYATPVLFTMEEEPMVAVFAKNEIAGVRVGDGEVVWTHPWETRYDVNAADPIVSGDTVFVSSGYGKGAGLIRFSGDGETELVWKNDEMKNHFNSCVLIGEHLYGIDGESGDRNPELKCLEHRTGKVVWNKPVLGTGALTAAGKRLIVISGKGELMIVEATPEQFNVLARAHVIGGRNWTAPVLSNGRLYVRNSQGRLLCLDVSQSEAVAMVRP